MKRQALIITLLTCSLAYGGVYVVKSGDTLSEILFSNVEGPIYGEGGNLAKLLKANPEISNPNYIEVAQKIRFPKSFKAFEQRLMASSEGISSSSDNDVLESSALPSKQKRKVDESKSLHSWFYGLRLNSESISAQDNSSGESEIATSDLAYGAFVRWSHKWNENLDFFFDVSLSKYSFEVAKDKTLSEDSLTKAYGGVGVKYKPNQNHSFEMTTGLGESLLLTSDTSTNLKIDKVVIPSVSVAGSHTLKRFKNGYSLNGFWRGGGLLPTSQTDYDTEFGTHWSVGTGSNYEKDGKVFNISISYGQRSVETDNLKQTNKDIGISAGIGFEF